MKSLFMVIYLASDIIGAAGPLAVNDRNCAIQAAELTNRIKNIAAKEIKSKYVEYKANFIVKCEWHETRPVHRGELKLKAKRI